MQNLLDAYPIVIETPVAWGEMDAFGHVNNAVYFRYCESARLAYFEAVGIWEAMEKTGIGPILGSASCRFKAPLAYPDTISVGARITDLQADRYTMVYAIQSHRENKIVTTGESLIVCYDYKKKTTAPLSESLRTAISKLQSKSPNG